MTIEELLHTCKALADPTRLRIVRMLEVKPLCVCEVMAVLGMAQSTTSRHLRILNNAGLVEEIPGTLWTVYRRPTAPTPQVRRFLALLDAVDASPQCTRDTSRARSADRQRLCAKKYAPILRRK